MASETETQFRDIEHRLDASLARDHEAIIGAGLSIYDSSQRTYHYKNEELCWSFRFESKRPRGSEYEKTVTCITVSEDNLELARCYGALELFQQGKLPRWRQLMHWEVPVDQLMQLGIAGVVIPHMKKGLKTLAEVV